MKKHWTQKLKKLGACKDAVIWAFEQENLEKAWQNCERGDWMLWLAGKTAGPSGDTRRKKLVLAAVECAELSISYVRAGENRPAKALRIARDWAIGGKSTLEDVKSAAAAAYASAAAADANASAAAAAYVAYVASAAADDADDAAYARKKTLKKSSDIVRKYYSEPPKI